MSRGRRCNTVHVVADSVEQAVEDLTRNWTVDHRPRWAIDSGTPATEPLAVEHHDRAPAGMRAALHHARLEAERRAVAAAIPPDPSPEIARVDRQLAKLRRDRIHLLTGEGRYAGTPVGHAARRYIEARERHFDAQRQAETSDSWRDRRHWRKEATRWADEESTAETNYVATVGPEVSRVDQTITDLEDQRDELHTARRKRTAWLADHPEAIRRSEPSTGNFHPLLELPEIQTLGHHHAANLRREAGIEPPAKTTAPKSTSDLSGGATSLLQADVQGAAPRPQPGLNPRPRLTPSVLASPR